MAFKKNVLIELSTKADDSAVSGLSESGELFMLTSLLCSSNHRAYYY